MQPKSASGGLSVSEIPPQFRRGSNPAGRTKRKSLLDIVKLERELSTVLGEKVDLLTSLIYWISTALAYAKYRTQVTKFFTE